MGKAKAIPINEPQAIIPKTANQQKLFEAIKNYNQVIITGPPGTGKTYITAGMAADWFASSNKHSLFICRPIVSNGDDIGFLPGSEAEKATPWAMPALNVTRGRIGAGKLDCDLNQGRIVVKPLQMMQGYSLDNCWLVVDEAQEMTVSQARMIVTRMGMNSKLLLNGDIRQCNLKEDSGLSYLMGLIKLKNMPVPIVEFDMDDCQRSEECKMWIKAIY